MPTSDAATLHDVRVDVGAVLMALAFIPEVEWTGFHRIVFNTLTETERKLEQIEDGSRV